MQQMWIAVSYHPAWQAANLQKTLGIFLKDDIFRLLWSMEFTKRNVAVKQLRPRICWYNAQPSILRRLQAHDARAAHLSTRNPTQCEGENAERVDVVLHDEADRHAGHDDDIYDLLAIYGEKWFQGEGPSIEAYRKEKYRNEERDGGVEGQDRGARPRNVEAAEPLAPVVEANDDYDFRDAQRAAWHEAAGTQERERPLFSKPWDKDYRRAALDRVCREIKTTSTRRSKFKF